MVLLIRAPNTQELLFSYWFIPIDDSLRPEARTVRDIYIWDDEEWTKEKRVDGEEPGSCHVVWDQRTKEFKEGAAAASNTTELKNETAIEYHSQETIISLRRGISL